MPISNTQERYGWLAISFHWVIAIMMIAMIILGLTMADMPKGLERLRLVVWHKQLGMTILMLGSLRLLWRLRSVQPLVPPSMPSWQRISAHISHMLLYLLMFLMPISGWLMSSAAGVSVPFYGLFVFPDIIAANRDWVVFFKTLHNTLAFTLMGIIGLHTAAALKHHYWDKDSVLRRMLP